MILIFRGDFAVAFLQRHAQPQLVGLMQETDENKVSSWLAWL
jgi:hypothetical protein